MIPKIIHYCWFGRGEKSELMKKCIHSWKEKLPDYQIIEWNEENFDVNQLEYTKDAYNARKYAFVSDVARVKALYEMGGIYLDTDVEVYQSFDSILNNTCVLGFEEECYVATSMMAAIPQFPLFKQFYEIYKNESFLDENGNLNQTTNVRKLTDMLMKEGLNRKDEYQILSNGITVYPKEYFSPYNYAYGVLNKTEKSICVHHFEVSWLPKKSKIFRKIKKFSSDLIGLENTKKIRNLLVRK